MRDHRQRYLTKTPETTASEGRGDDTSDAWRNIAMFEDNLSQLSAPNSKRLQERLGEFWWERLIHPWDLSATPPPQPQQDLSFSLRNFDDTFENWDPILMRAAIGYWCHGYSPIPLNWVTDQGKVHKRPLLAWKHLIYRRPTLDEVVNAFSATGRGRYGTHVWANGIALLCGQAHGLYVVDLDPGHGSDDSMATIEAVAGPVLGNAPTEVSARGGQHIFFAPTSVPLAKQITAQGGTVTIGDRTVPVSGIDLLAECCYVVVTPTRTDDGGYEHLRETPVLPTVDGLALDLRLPEVFITLEAHTKSPHPTTVSRRRGSDTPHTGRASTEEERDEFIELWKHLGVVVTGEGDYGCPFHEDLHPSLHIKPDACVFFCHAGCGGGGLTLLRQRHRSWSLEPHAKRSGSGPPSDKREVSAAVEPPLPPSLLQPPEGSSLHQRASTCPDPIPLFRQDIGESEGRRVPVDCRKHRCPYCGPRLRASQAAAVAAAFANEGVKVTAQSLPESKMGALRQWTRYYKEKGETILWVSIPTPDGERLPWRAVLTNPEDRYKRSSRSRAPSENRSTLYPMAPLTAACPPAGAFERY